LAVTDWRLRRWRLWFLALMTATLTKQLAKKLELNRGFNLTRNIKNTLGVKSKATEQVRPSSLEETTKKNITLRKRQHPTGNSKTGEQ